ncbi:MFS transporter [Streptomyces rubiginosohelvolus]
MTQVQESSGARAARPAPRRNGWPGVAALALGTFTVVTSEMLPVGLLTPMGRSLGVPEGVAGLTLTITGLVAALSAPALVPLLGRADRRTALCVLVAVLVVGNLGAAWAPDFATMVVARVLVGVGMGGVWAVAAGLAVRLVPAKSAGTATSLVFSGIAVASVLGVPAGTYLGDLAGWRAAFLAAAGLGAVVLVAAALLLPAERTVPFGGALRLTRDPRLRTGLLVVGFLVTGHFAAYTYIRPVLEDVSGVGAGTIGVLLLVYGIAGVAGNFLGGAGAARSPRTTLLVIGTVLALTVAALPWLGGSPALAAVLMVLWGLGYGGVSVSTQTWVLLAAPDAREAASSLFVGVFNAAIALGALAGGLVADGVGVTAVTVTGAALVAGALVTNAAGRAPVPEAPAVPGKT